MVKYLINLYGSYFVVFVKEIEKIDKKVHIF